MAQLIRERSSPGQSFKGRASKGVKKEQVGASLGWQPWADDSHVLANVQHLLNCCAAATGRTLEWHDPLATPAATAEVAGSGQFRQRVIVKAMYVVKKAIENKLASLMDTDKEPKVVIVADLDEAASEARLLQAAARRARLGSEFVLANEDAHVSKVELDLRRLVTGDL
jgi:hypothetical protein